MKTNVLILALLLIGFAATPAKAQTVVSENIHGTTQETTTQKVNSEVEQKNSSVEFDYLAVEDGFGIGMNLVINRFFVALAMSYGTKDSDSFRDQSSWHIGLGYNYRHYFAKSFFIEGRAGVGYYHGSYEYKVSASNLTRANSVPSQHGKNNTSSTTWKKESNGEFGMFISPRIGIRLFELWGNDLNLVAGYRWDFNKFKFSKEYTNDYFTVGIASTF